METLRLAHLPTAVDVGGTCPSSDVTSLAQLPTPVSLASAPSTAIKSLKRPRILADVEGEDAIATQRKKRRLRLELITSRLSRPFASPTTHIVGRGAVRVGIWARRPGGGSNVFQKAAILNSIKRDRAATQDLLQERLVLCRAVSAHSPDVNADLDIMPHRYQPSKESRTENASKPADSSQTPAPWTCSTPNYDVFDDEDENLDDDDQLIVDYQATGGETEADSDPDDYETLCPFDEVVIEHHHKPKIDCKPENVAIAREFDFILPSERCAMEPFF